MSFSSSPISSLVASAAVAAASPAATVRASTGPARTDNAVTVDTFPASPPTEVHEAIARAAAVWQHLADSGQTLRFRTDEPNGQVSATLTDPSGTAQRLSGSEILALADGQ